ncbi:MAG: 8-oxo-dGTP diphosphatase [Verrucomicrobiales bacterium]
MSDAEVPDWAAWQPEIEATLVFVREGSRVLLIEKLRGIGKGKINGPGGKIDPGETPLECAIRETQEELHITPTGLEKMGELWFAMLDLPDIHCHVYLADGFEGEPTATEEAIPFWCEIAEIPFARMWEDDRHWLPRMLVGEKFDARFLFSEEKIRWKDLVFGNEASTRWGLARG